MKVAKLKVEGETFNHHPGVNQVFDLALCGQDLSGDSWLGWETAEVIDGKINCPECLRIIIECRSLKETDFTTATEVAH